MQTSLSSAGQSCGCLCSLRTVISFRLHHTYSRRAGVNYLFSFALIKLGMALHGAWLLHCSILCRPLAAVARKDVNEILSGLNAQTSSLLPSRWIFRSTWRKRYRKNVELFSGSIVCIYFFNSRQNLHCPPTQTLRVRSFFNTQGYIHCNYVFCCLYFLLIIHIS